MPPVVRPTRGAAAPPPPPPEPKPELKPELSGDDEMPEVPPPPSPPPPASPRDALVDGMRRVLAPVAADLIGDSVDSVAAALGLTTEDVIGILHAKICELESD